MEVGDDQSDHHRSVAVQRKLATTRWRPSDTVRCRCGAAAPLIRWLLDHRRRLASRQAGCNTFVRRSGQDAVDAGDHAREEVFRTT